MNNKIIFALNNGFVSEVANKITNDLIPSSMDGIYIVSK
jgi:hypothetical protein